MTGELRSLIRIEYFRSSIFFQSFLKDFDTEGEIQWIWDPPGKNLSWIPIDDSYEVDESSFHSNVGDIRTPDLISMGDNSIIQKIWILLVLFVWYARVLVGIECFKSKGSHEISDWTSPHLISFLFQENTESSGSEERIFDIESPKPCFDFFFFQIRIRYIVVSWSGNTKKLSLTGNTEKVKIRIDQRNFFSTVILHQAV